MGMTSMISKPSHGVIKNVLSITKRDCSIVITNQSLFS